MFPQLGSTTAEGFSKASSLMMRIGTDAHLYDDPDDANIPTLIDSKFDSDKLEALKRLLALIAQGVDVANFFPQVVKNVASQSLEVKKLVYLYLLHYAQKRPDEALLSINCFQKDLSDTNPLVRAWALRTMTGIRLQVVAPLVLMAINKCARDPSVYVRKCAANALPKLHDLHLEESASVVELIKFLLSDQSPGVVGAAAAAFNYVCPDNLLIITNDFRRLCEMLPDVEEWGQIVLIDILLRYVVARYGLVKESFLLMRTSVGSVSDKDSFEASRQISENHNYSMNSGACESKFIELMLRSYLDGPEQYLGHYLNDVNDFVISGNLLTSSKNSEVEILLRCTLPLLWSQNSAVVLAAAGLHWILSPREEVHRIVNPLLFILRSCHPSKYIVLSNILVFAKVFPSLFAPYYGDFFVSSMDSYHIKSLKLDILSSISTDSSISFIFEEFQDYIKDPDRRFVADTVAALGVCARRLPSIASTCLEGLMAIVLQESSMSSLVHMDEEAGILDRAIMSIKEIVEQNPVDHDRIIVCLARNLDKVKEPMARALIIWIVGEFNSIGHVIPRILPTLLKYLAHCFISEAVETKCQIINISAKVVLNAEKEEEILFKKILRYILEVAKYDLSYDIRDRARTIENTMVLDNGSDRVSNDTIHSKLRKQIFHSKTWASSYSEKVIRFYLPGSLSQIVFHAAPGYVPLPKPCSLLENNFMLTGMDVERSMGSVKTGNSNSLEMKNPKAYTEFSDASSSYDSHPSDTCSSESDGGGSAGDSDKGNIALIMNQDTQKEKNSPLIQLSDTRANQNQRVSLIDTNISTSLSTDLAELMSRSSLESWLNEQPSTSIQKDQKGISASISINGLAFSIKAKVQNLLDPRSGNGLCVEYAFSSEISAISPLLICIDLFFYNWSDESLASINVKDAEPDEAEFVNQELHNPESLRSGKDTLNLQPIEEIPFLHPGQTVKKVAQVHFNHHLLPLKLAVFCNGKKYLTKLFPDIGYFLRPLTMTLESFLEKECQLRGMFEHAKRCTFTNHVQEQEQESACLSYSDKFLSVARSLASKVLSNSNVHLVSIEMPVSSSIDDSSGLCLRFSGQISVSSIPCLITLKAEGICFEASDIIAKVNSEDTVFGLNLLNRVATFLQ